MKKTMLPVPVLLALCGSLLAAEQKDALPGNMSGMPLPEFGQKAEREVAETMKKRRIPGVVLVVVHDGRIVLSRGYGLADLEKKTAVVPDRTIFRAGSISKLFTATAVMQLAERGQLDLEANVNHYLRRFKVAESFPLPVTTAHLLTHTAGFAEYIHGLHPLDESGLQPLGDYLARRLPPRIRPPGQLFSYNDHGYSLAGFLVQEISGVPFEAYVDRNIFAPLGMSRSSFGQRLPSDLAGDLATGYRYKDGRFEPYSLDYCQVVPAAGLYSTAHDLARFMIAHLRLGRFQQARILNEETAREMQRRHFVHHPKLRGRAYGFSELLVNGKRAIFHDGGMPGFNSRLCLLPEEDIGFFLAWNSDDLRLKNDLTLSFFDHFFPRAEKPAATLPVSIAATPVKDLAGCYEEVAGLSTTCLRMGGILMNYLPVIATRQNTLRTAGSEFSEVEPLLFRDAVGFPLAFQQDAKDHRQYLFIGAGAMERLPWYETPNTLLAQAVFFLLMFLPMGLVWPLGLISRRSMFRASWQRHFPQGRFLAGLVSFLFLFFLVGYVALFLQIDHYWQIMRNEYPWNWLTRLLVVPLLAGILSAGLPACTVAAWIRKSGTLGGRLYYTLVTVSALTFIWLLNHWNLVGFKY